MVESMLNISTLSFNWLMRLHEELTWTEIKNKENGKNDFSINDGPLYSWDNLMEDGIMVLARLDRLYFFPLAQPKTFLIIYAL